MIPKAFIFIGRSGSGKGTQAKLLEEFLVKKDPKTAVFYLQTGEQFRNFIQGDTHTQKLSNALYTTGALQPAFLAIYMWAKAFTENLKGGERLIVDGTPRKLSEVGILQSVFDFYKLGKPVVLFMNVSEGEARKRLLERHRMDDTKSDVELRLAWYHTDVEPAVDWYRSARDCHFLDINGEQTPEQIHEEIVTKVSELATKKADK